jgi:hypothetical protein
MNYYGLIVQIHTEDFAMNTIYMSCKIDIQMKNYALFKLNIPPVRHH